MSVQIQSTKKYLYGHISPETAYIVEGYPWGFRLRTTIRYWIETSTAKNGGQRFCSQTINPKTGAWCAPKKGTYNAIAVMFLDENEHVKYECLRVNDRIEEILEFKKNHLSFLDEFQKKSLREIMAYNEVMKHVTWTCTPSTYGPVSLFSQKPEDIEKRRLIAEEQEKNEIEKATVLKKINRAVAYEYHKIGEL